MSEEQSRCHSTVEAGHVSLRPPSRGPQSHARMRDQPGAGGQGGASEKATFPIRAALARGPESYTLNLTSELPRIHVCSGILSESYLSTRSPSVKTW